MAQVRTRKEPPPFRPVEVAHVEQRTPLLIALTLAGAAFDGLDPGLPAASVRLLLPDPGSGELALPTWNGNEFLTDDGKRPLIRTVTPLRFDPIALDLDIEVVLHGESPLTAWATKAAPGSPVAVSGTGRGYEIDDRARHFLLVGDEAAVPAIETLLPHLPAEAEVRILIEVRDPAARLELASPAHTSIEWLELPEDARPGEAMVAALVAEPIDPGARVWAAGEAAAVHQIRRHLFEQVGLPRSQATVRGYWKVGRAEGG